VCEITRNLTPKTLLNDLEATLLTETFLTPIPRTY